jgi:antitoxin component of RelBE/YafQ-DinJ toxin-antitoxin module
MTVIFRGRVDPDKLKKGEKGAENLGTSVPELVRIFIAEVARTGSVPLSMTTRDGDPLFSKERRNQMWASLITPKPGEVYMIDLGIAGKICPAVIVSRGDAHSP